MRGKQSAAPDKSLEATLDNYVRVYEEKLIIDVAAEIYANFADKGGIRLDDLDGMLSAPSQTVAMLFRKYDADHSGTIDAKELLAIVRHLNFMRGFCDECFKPVGGDDSAFICVPCDTFMLCAECYPRRAQVHPEHSHFKPAALMERQNAAATDFPQGVGAFLRQMVVNLFEEIDDNGDGEISIQEFLHHCVANGWSLEFVLFVLNFDLNGDGCISPREALYMLTGLAMMRSCDECGELSFVSDEDLLSCVECTADYDVCASCWNAGRCSHHHDRFETTKPFQLRSLGLYYEHRNGNTWRIAVGDSALWQKYKPFVGDKVNMTATVRCNLGALVV